MPLERVHATAVGHHEGGASPTVRPRGRARRRGPCARKGRSCLERGWPPTGLEVARPRSSISSLVRPGPLAGVPLLQPSTRLDLGVGRMISAVCRARTRGDETTTGTGPDAPAATPAWRRPSSESGGSAWPCHRPSAFHSDWPWRTSSRRTTRDGSYAPGTCQSSGCSPARAMPPAPAETSSRAPPWPTCSTPLASRYGSDFDAVLQQCRVWVNGEPVTTHDPGGRRRRGGGPASGVRWRGGRRDRERRRPPPRPSRGARPSAGPRCRPAGPAASPSPTTSTGPTSGSASSGSWSPSAACSSGDEAGLAAVYALTAALAGYQIARRWQDRGRHPNESVAAAIGGLASAVRPVGAGRRRARPPRRRRRWRSSPRSPRRARADQAALGDRLHAAVRAVRRPRRGLAHAGLPGRHRCRRRADHLRVGVRDGRLPGRLRAPRTPSRARWPASPAIAVFAFALWVATFVPFKENSLLAFGAMAAGLCPVGQLFGSAILPRSDAKASAVRRLDSLLVLGPGLGRRPSGLTLEII